MDNYFSLYGLPVSFRPDAAAVKKQYYALSRQYHPDRFTQAGADEQAAALRQSALNNEAYRTLSDADRTMAYVLRLQGVLEEEEKYSLPPGFLMEMMDLNELLSDYEDQPENTGLRTQVAQALQQQLDAWQQEVNPLLDQYTPETASAPLLAQLKDFYFRKKYLLRIQERLITFAAR